MRRSAVAAGVALLALLAACASGKGSVCLHQRFPMAPLMSEKWSLK